jgi:hypothetical protein
MEPHTDDRAVCPVVGVLSRSNVAGRRRAANLTADIAEGSVDTVLASVDASRRTR